MKKIIIYSRSICPYCDMAKNLLSSKGYEYEEKNAEEYSEEFIENAQKYGHMTVPMIFIGDEFVGGFDQLHLLNTNNRLDEMINAE